MHKVFVTGASGFIGRALCHDLTFRGYHVVASLRDKRLAVGFDAKTEFHVSGTMGPQKIDWRNVLRDTDSVVHLAARVHQRGPEDTIAAKHYREVNIGATSELVSQAVESDIKRFIFISSVKVNGEGQEDAYTEENLPQPRGYYAESKWKAELLVREIANQGNMPFTILRPPLVYGPGVGGNFLTMVKLIGYGIPVPVASLNKRRSMIYIANLTDAIERVLKNPSVSGNVFLVSDDHDFSVAELVKKLSHAMGRPSRIFPVPPKVLALLCKIAGKGQLIDKLTQSLTVDITKIEKTLGWRPPYTAAKGIADTAAWFNKTYRI